MAPTSEMPAKARARAQSVIAYGQRQVDRVVSPPARQRAYDSTYAFANARPILSSFLLAQLVFGLLPLLFFLGFVLSAAALSLVGAVVLALFWAGVAALVLAPVLFLASGLALLVWAWALSAFLLGRCAWQALPPDVRRDVRTRLPGGASFSGSGSGGGGKKVIFLHHQHQTNGGGEGLIGEFEADVKAEAAEVKE